MALLCQFSFAAIFTGLSPRSLVLWRGFLGIGREGLARLVPYKLYLPADWPMREDAYLYFGGVRFHHRKFRWAPSHLR